MIKTRYFIFILLMGCSNLLFAQAYGGGADQNDLSFGFTFSFVQSSFKIVKKPDWRKPYFDADVNRNITDSLNSISSKTLPGFAVGFITRYRLTDHLEARITPALVFADRSLSYAYKTPSQDVDKSVQTTTVDFPLQLKLKSDRVGNVRAYLIGGAKFSNAIGSKKNSDANASPLEKAVKNVKSYSSYEAGFGFDIYFEYFKLSPEVKLSNSFTNMLVPENHPYSTPISSLGLHTIMFSLYFE
ncbi:PorT family protein [Inquilinus sp. KBS0705]|nr:PorT family protein [Inquilinus sp. KBS0705]